MIRTVAQIATTLQDLLTTTAAQAGRDSGFVQRTSKLDGARLAQMITFTLLATPTPSLSDYTQTAAACGLAISPQGLDQRLTTAAAACLKQVLEVSMQAVVAVHPVALPLLRRFPGGVFIQDSTTIALPASYADLWQGCGGPTEATGAAAIKVQIQLDVLHGQLSGALEDGRASDQRATLDQHIPAQALHLADLGYWDLSRLAALSARDCWWLSRMHTQTQLQTTDGTWWRLLDLLAAQGAVTEIDLSVVLGKTEHLHARLLARRVPQEVADQRRRRLRETAKRKGRPVSADQLALAAWTMFVTNVPLSLLTVGEALVLGRVRWQIELLFKRWKSHGQVDYLPTVQRGRFLCALYGRLLAMVVQHWVLVTTCWDMPDRSLVKAAQVVRLHALILAKALPAVRRLAAALRDLARTVALGCRLNPRKTQPNTVQLLLNPELAP